MNISVITVKTTRGGGWEGGSVSGGWATITTYRTKHASFPAPSNWRCLSWRRCLLAPPCSIRTPDLPFLRSQLPLSLPLRVCGSLCINPVFLITYACSPGNHPRTPTHRSARSLQNSSHLPSAANSKHFSEEFSVRFVVFTVERKWCFEFERGKTRRNRNRALNITLKLELLSHLSSYSCNGFKLRPKANEVAFNCCLLW